MIFPTNHRYEKGLTLKPKTQNPKTLRFLISFTSSGAHQWTVLRGGAGNDQAAALQVGFRVSGFRW